MQKLLLILLATLTLSSCVTQRRCLEKFPPEVTVKDSIIRKDSIVYRDTVIYLPGERITIQDVVWCDSLNRAQLPKKSVRTKHLTAVVEIKDGKLNVDCNEDSLIAVNAKLKEKYSEIEKMHSRVEVREKIVYKTRWYDYFARSIAGVAIAALAIWLLIKRFS